MENNNTTIRKVLFPHAIIQHVTVEYADVQHERAEARGVQQDAIHGTVHECKHSYRSFARCTSCLLYTI